MDDASTDARRLLIGGLLFIASVGLFLWFHTAANHEARMIFLPLLLIGFLVAVLAFANRSLVAIMAASLAATLAAGLIGVSLFDLLWAPLGTERLFHVSMGLFLVGGVAQFLVIGRMLRQRHAAAARDTRAAA